MSRPLLLDLFCGAGGAAVGYHRAGFDVVGVDIVAQPHYPFRFVRADALRPPFDLGAFDIVHASPPCQAYSTLAAVTGADYPHLYEPTRTLLESSGRPWVVENVIGAPYRSGVMLCGSMFGLRVRRHRNFESSVMMMPPTGCDHVTQGTPLGVYGYGGGGQMTRGYKAHRRDWPLVMGMPWATADEIAQAIPPAYTEHIGAQLLAFLRHPGSS